MLVETASGRRGYRPGQYAEEDADASMVSFSLFCNTLTFKRMIVIFCGCMFLPLISF
jgi:hypothetical protein